MSIGGFGHNAVASLAPIAPYAPGSDPLLFSSFEPAWSLGPAARAMLTEPVALSAYVGAYTCIGEGDLDGMPKTLAHLATALEASGVSPETTEILRRRAEHLRDLEEGHVRDAAVRNNNLIPTAIQLRRVPANAFLNAVRQIKMQYQLRLYPWGDRDYKVLNRLRKPPPALFTGLFWGIFFRRLLPGQFEELADLLQRKGDWLMMAGRIVEARRAYHREGIFRLREIFGYLGSDIVERADSMSCEEIDEKLMGAATLAEAAEDAYRRSGDEDGAHKIADLLGDIRADKDNTDLEIKKQFFVSVIRTVGLLLKEG